MTDDPIMTFQQAVAALGLIAFAFTVLAAIIIWVVGVVVRWLVGGDDR